MTLADGRTAAMDDTDTADDLAPENLQRRIEQKFMKLSGALADAQRGELLARLNAIEERSVAGIFSL